MNLEKVPSKLKRWQNELDGLLETCEKDLRWLCDYLDAAYNENGVSFYQKLPKKRTTYIGIGMAFHQPLEVINTWICNYASKKKLYVKDISEDLIWIYLINLNRSHSNSSINYFKRYEECQSVAFAAYSEVWEDAIYGSLTTAEVEVILDKTEYDDGFKGLTRFITENIDSFKTAYSKPRQYLDNYFKAIFRAGININASHKYNLNNLRGFLDDSMINYLSGDHSTINTYDRVKKKRTLNIKYIPRSRRFHISLCLALGMSLSELNNYLDLMGFSNLSYEDKTERLLIELLIEWEKTHPLQCAYKDHLFSVYNAKADNLGSDVPDNYAAFQEEMLFLRKELHNRFMEHNIPFPYLSDWRKYDR